MVSAFICRNIRRTLCCLAAMLVMAAAPGGLSANPSLGPKDQVETTVNEILTILKEKVDTAEMKEERRKRVISTIESCFDFREMSQRTLAAHWKKISNEEQDNFVRLFTRLLENVYIAKIEKYTDEKILFKDQDVKDDKAEVASGILKKDIEIPIVYRLMKENDQWLVYDVVIEGISLVRNYRSQFDPIFTKEKYAGLITRMEEKIKTAEAPKE